MNPGRALRTLHRAEDLLLALVLIVLVLLAAAQILLRTVFDTGLLWLDPLLRTLVLWVAMLGAMVAAREGRHIGLDLFGRVLPPRPLRMVRFVTHVFAAGVCVLLAWHALRMVLDEREFGTMAFASVPGWLAQSILPVALAVIALRLLIGAVRPAPPPPPSTGSETVP